MSALITTRSPTSYQLRLSGVNCRKYPSPSVFLRMHVHKLEYQIHCFSGSVDNTNAIKRRRRGFDCSVKAFSGWSGEDDNGAEVLNENSEKKRWSGGIVGAAVAGVVLVGGLAFATLSINRRASGPKKNMETLTKHQEESLTSDQNDNVEDEGTETKNDNYVSNEKENEITNDNEPDHSTAIEGSDVTDNVSVQQELQEELPEHKSNVDDDPVDASSIVNHEDNLVDENLESSNNILEDVPADVKVADSVVTDVNSINPDTGSDEVNVILEPTSSKNEDFDNKETQVFSGESLTYTYENEKNDIDFNKEIKETFFESVDLGKISSTASIPAPSVLSPALQALPGKVLVPAVVDQVQGQALAALQVLKVIEGDVQPGDLCSRREYARWLVSASSALSRNTISKVYPAMYIENVTELAFDDITPEDPDFSSIQGLAEAGLIASKLSQRDMNISNQDDSSLHFYPESPLSRQDLVSWKMSLEKRLLPVADRTILQQLSGFIDTDKINPDAWPALIADLSAGENGIVSLAFGYTRLFQPDKPVTKAQAAIALATGEASDIVSEELARIEAESMAEKAVAAHTALVDQVQKDINTYYENDLQLEREKITALEKLAEETRQELDRLKAEQEEQNVRIMKERAAVDSQMEMLSKLRREAEEELQGIMSNKVEISYEKERINKLRTDAEIENQEIVRLQYELEVERKALAMARSWAEDEAKRAREQAKVLEDARSQWESQGLKVIVDKDLRDESMTESTWVNAQKTFSVEETETRAETLVDQLKSMAANVKGKSKQIINMVIEKVQLFISQLKELCSKTVNHVGAVKDGVVLKVNGSMQDLQQSTAGLSLAAKDGVKRVVGDCREGVEKLSQKFKT
ncbi:putative S-layer domain-containing protein [Helianthus annuus]|uniref:S-layer domain-containing protein n=1 Tax=Helianthus annuus TaxID=4232 RepID=A0A9K3N832_HELAN|nr:putative S-layer domain-containing protein [Helianthus annuus]KAJ0525777.1 putative S-layer domain-containing protein [Helianthus annuus]KAJ0542166.1 putative S-layer domain-containing protein [Helianthus annuus]KAJ0707224.1 putative S-layer domain-containing protein [Helianthus annuus]KAJ0711242.1 putative S-layer domain-containing protein [Helianthus annuus]